MAMPEATMNKDCNATTYKDDVRITWQIASMNPKSVTHSVKRRSNSYLRQSIFATDAAHVP